MLPKKLSKEKQEHKIHETQDWIYAFQLALPIFFITLYYHYIRRGVFLPFFTEHGISFIYLVNKALALTGVALVVISILIGPLAAFFPSFGKKIGCRKEIGLLGFFLAIGHIIITLLFIYWDFNWAFLTGLLAFLFFLAIVVFAGTRKSLISLGYRKWKTIQRLVYPALFFTFLHILFSDKVAVWQEYLAQPSATSYLPPGTLVITAFILFGFFLRFVVFIKDRLK